MLKLSRYGARYTGRSGIVSLMEDLGSALRDNPQMIMMGGGTPDRIPAVEAVFHEHLQKLAADPLAVHALLGRYQGPQGDPDVRQLLAETLQAEYGWPVTARNIALSNGGQSAFGILANMLAGSASDGSVRLIQFPLVPEYLGYADIGLVNPFFTASRPALELLPDQLFKYHVDFANLQIGDDVAALCVSRPTNPSGNVLTDREVADLDSLARAKGIPLILDTAYGAPFPGVQFGGTNAYWSENVIMLSSLSKLGLPGLRSGFVIASEETVAAFSSINTILNLACGNTGPMLAASLMRTGDLMRLSSQVIRPWYEQKMERALDQFRQTLGDIPCRVHKPEGAFFLWLWFRDLPVSCEVLYEMLKQAGVLVIPGHTSFPGLDDDWDHMHQCLRLSYAVEDEQLRDALGIIARVVKPLYDKAG